MFDTMYKLICFGLGGFIAYGNDEYHSTLSGYESDASLFFNKYHWWADPKDVLRYHIEPAQAEGAYVVDKVACLTRLNASKAAWLVITGPLPKVNLADDEVDKLSKETLQSSMVAQAVSQNKGNLFGTFVKSHLTSQAKYGSLDYVSVKIYCDLWREIGARIGQVKNGQIIWED